MSNPNQTDPRKSFAICFLPWLLGAAMLIVYYLTLNRWVNLFNINAVAQASGQAWQDEVFNPLLCLVLWPIHFLAPAKIPLVLNLVSAVCGSLVLVLLARSVAILPHDHTEPQRERERNDFGFLTGWPALFAPAMAVLFGGLQMTFWEHATNFTGEMVDLVLFAFIVWLLLEYRIDEKPWRLNVAALALGVGLAETWGFIGFLPVFLIVIIWLKRLDFFNLVFLFRLLVCGLAGLSLIFLLPLIAKFTGSVKIGFWEAVRNSLGPDWDVITILKYSFWRHNVAEASLSTLLPVLIFSLRWSASFGDSSRIGSWLANNMLHFVYAVVFSVCIWAAFDPPFSSGQLLSQPALKLYYLSALSIGYFCGYFLLVFGKKPQPSRRNPRPLPLYPPAFMWICPLVVAGVFICAAFTLSALLYRNVPAIRDVNSNVLQKFAAASTETLPKDGAIALCDSDWPGQNATRRSTLIQAMLEQEGRHSRYPVVDTLSVYWEPYQKLLHAKFPEKWPAIPAETNSQSVDGLQIMNQLVSLSRSNILCYVNPSYGYFFEYFYQEPHGLVYLMKKLPDDSLQPPPLDSSLISQNEEFWDRTIESLHPAIMKALNGPEIHANPNPLDRLLAHLHPTPIVNQNSILAGMFLSRSLNAWGVQLQQAGQLDKAAIRFKSAKELDPDNVVADINLAFNQAIRSGTPMQLAPVTADQFGKYNNWNDVITINGPFDDASFRYAYGSALMEDGMYHQAAQQFSRIVQLMPGNLGARLRLANLYLFNRQPDRALESLHDPLTQPGRFGLNETNSAGLNILAASVYFQKNQVSEAVRLVKLETSRHPDDETLIKTAIQAYMVRHMYANAMELLDAGLVRSPDDVQFLFGKGYVSLQTSNYDGAITAMNHILQLEATNPMALFNRGLAYLDTGKLDLSRADFSTLQKSYPKSYQVAYGLGEIATRRNDTNEIIRNLKIYLANAPTNSIEFKSVHDRLTQLRGQ